MSIRSNNLKDSPPIKNYDYNASLNPLLILCILFMKKHPIYPLTMAILISACDFINPPLPPVAQSQQFEILESLVLTAELEAKDPNNDPMQYELLANGHLGTVILEDSTLGTFSYTPYPGLYGTDTFHWIASDEQGRSNMATATIHILQANISDGIPTTTSMNLSTKEDTHLTGLLDSDDEDGDPLTHTLILNGFPVSEITGDLGSLSLTNSDTGQFSYTPIDNIHSTTETPQDMFYFRVNDGKGFSNVSSLIIHVTSVNDTPQLSTPRFEVLGKKPANYQLEATDPEDDPITYRISTPPKFGQISQFDPLTGTFEYTANENTLKTDYFNYTASDGNAEATPVRIVLNVVPYNHPPEIDNQTWHVFQNTPHSGIFPIIEYENDPTNIAVLNAPTHGELSIDSVEQSYLYTAHTDFIGTDTFEITVVDNLPRTQTPQPTTVEVITHPVLQTMDSSIAEADNAQLNFTLQLTGVDTLPVSVSYTTLANTATAGEDYETTQGTLTFAPGETEKQLPINILNDDKDEIDTQYDSSDNRHHQETFYLQLSQAINTRFLPATNSESLDRYEATAIITDDDPSPQAVFSSPETLTLNEGEQQIIHISLTGSSNLQFYIPLSLSGSSEMNSDYQISSNHLLDNNVLEIPPNSQTLSITLTALEDSLGETHETLTLQANTPFYITPDGRQQPYGSTDGNSQLTLALLNNDAPPSQTGQTISYTAYDDGDAQHGRQGVAWPQPRFTDNGNGTITDKLTGLMWLKKADSGKMCFTTEADSRVTWNEALTHIRECNTLQVNNGPIGVAGFQDWRLPSVREINSLIHYGQAQTIGQSLFTSPFLETDVRHFSPTDMYWSSTSNAEDTLTAWAFHLFLGSQTAANKTDSSFYVWPVRNANPSVVTTTNELAPVPQSGQKLTYLPEDDTLQNTNDLADDGTLQSGVVSPNPRFILDANKHTVSDQMSGLIWKQTADSGSQCGITHGVTTWDQALQSASFCTDNDGWRLPNIRELSSLIDFGQHHPALPDNHPFILPEEAEYGYWSSTTNSLTAGNETENDGQAWVVFLHNGAVEVQNKGGAQPGHFYTWLVRNPAPSL